MAAFKTLANLIDNFIKKKTVLVICMRKHLITMFGMKQAFGSPFLTGGRGSS